MPSAPLQKSFAATEALAPLSFEKTLLLPNSAALETPLHKNFGVLFHPSVSPPHKKHSVFFNTHPSINWWNVDSFFLRRVSSSLQKQKTNHLVRCFLSAEKKNDPDPAKKKKNQGKQISKVPTWSCGRILSSHIESKIYNNNFLARTYPPLFMRIHAACQNHRRVSLLHCKKLVGAFSTRKSPSRYEPLHEETRLRDKPWRVQTLRARWVRLWSSKKKAVKQGVWVVRVSLNTQNNNNTMFQKINPCAVFSEVGIYNRRKWDQTESVQKTPP